MRAADLARALNAKRSGRQFLCRCPAHDDATPSLIFWDGREAIRFKCFSGCEPEAIIAVLRHRGLWTNGERPSNVNSPRQEQERNRELALGIWRAAVPLAGTPGERYLTRRGLVLPPAPVARFHPNCPRGATRCTAVVVLMRSIVDGIPCAIQRIFVRDGVKDGKPMMLGPAGNAAMKLAPAGPTLTVCEGFETALALAARGHHPVWALGSAGAMQRFPLIAGISQLTVAVDNDAVGKQAATDVLYRWGARARGIIVDQDGADFADLAGGQK